MCHKEVSNRLIQKASDSNDITKQERLEWLTSQMGCLCERNTGKEHVILCTSWTYLMSRILSDFQVAKLEELFHGHRRKALGLNCWNGLEFDRLVIGFDVKIHLIESKKCIYKCDEWTVCTWKCFCNLLLRCGQVETTISCGVFRRQPDVQPPPGRCDSGAAAILMGALLPCTSSTCYTPLIWVNECRTFTDVDAMRVSQSVIPRLLYCLYWWRGPEAHCENLLHQWGASKRYKNMFQIRLLLWDRRLRRWSCNTWRFNSIIFKIKKYGI